MATTTTPESRGQLAYTAYGKRVGFKPFNGEPLRPWNEMPSMQREAWIAAAGLIWDLATTGHATM
jgi:hypothetical protein